MKVGARYVRSQRAREECHGVRELAQLTDPTKRNIGEQR
jgi:hypothetical protein